MGQRRAAVQLANRYLDQPIQPPVTCRAEAMAQRLNRTAIPAAKQAEAFFHFYLGTLNPEVGAALTGVFSLEDLYQYFRSELVQHSPKDYAFRTTIRNYLLLGLDFPGLLNMLANDSEESGLSMEQALKELFSFRIHVPLSEKNFQSVVLAPMRGVQKLLSNINNNTLAAIGVVGDLEQSADMARDRQADRAAQKPGKRLEKKPSIRQDLEEKKAQVAARSTPGQDRKPQEVSL